MLHCFTLHCTRSVHAASACSEQWSGACTFFTAEAWRAAPFLTANTSSPCASRDIPHYDPEQERKGPYNNYSSDCAPKTIPQNVTIYHKCDDLPPRGFK